MIIPLTEKDLLISSPHSFILCGSVKEPFTLFIETQNDEYCQHLAQDNLIVVSAPENGEIRQAIILLELVRTWHVPLVVLPPGHPGSCRLKMVVSAGDMIMMNCSIQRGTHPEQTVICSSEELAGITLKSVSGGVKITHVPECAHLSLVSADSSEVTILSLTNS
jgi:hypothetical protein